MSLRHFDCTYVVLENNDAHSFAAIKHGLCSCLKKHQSMEKRPKSGKNQNPLANTGRGVGYQVLHIYTMYSLSVAAVGRYS